MLSYVKILKQSIILKILLVQGELNKVWNWSVVRAIQDQVTCNLFLTCFLMLFSDQVYKGSGLLEATTS